MTTSSIVPDLWYRPRQIVANGWIRNAGNSSTSDYRHVIRLIHSGKLKARNICTTGKEYFRVLGADIIAFNRES